MGESDCEGTRWRIDRFVQSLSVLGLDLARETGLEQGCEPGSPFAFLNIENQNSYAANYYRQKLQSYRPRTDLQDLQQFRNRIKHFVASKADLIFKLKGKERLRCGIDYNVDTAQESYNAFATQLPPIESGMQVSSVARRAQIFELLKIGDIILGKVVGKRPFGVFVRILSLVHGRNLDFDNIDIQALCRKSELENDHKSREHLDPIDDFDIDDMVQGVICSISKDEERIAISFRSAKLPSEYGNIELGVIEDLSEKSLRPKSFDDDLDYNDCLKRDPGFSNPTNVQTLIDVLGVDCRPPNSLLRSCQRWTFNDDEADNLRKQQSKKWSMDTTAIGVGSFKSGDHEKALKYFNHALQIYEENSEALVARGALYANQNKLEYAIKDFKEALIQHPKHHNASKYLKETLFEKALRLKDIGNIREAISTFEEILGLDPNDIESQKHLKELKSVLSAKLVEESNRSRKAEGLLQENRRTFEHVRKLIKSDPDVVKRNRKKKRKKKKKLKNVKSKKRRCRRSEISDETTSTASETGSDARDSDDDEWVEKDKSSYSSRKHERVGHVSEESVEGRAILSNVSAKSVDFSSQSNLFQEVNASVKDRSFESCSSISKTHTQHGMNILIDNVVNTSCSITAAGVSYDTEGHLGGNLESVGGRERGGDGVERGKREKAREGLKDFKQTRKESNESEGSIRERFRLRGSHSRSRSRSYEKKHGSKDYSDRSNAKALRTRRVSGNNTSESDVDNGKKVSRRTGRGRSRGSRSRTRSTDDSGSSDRPRRRRSHSRSKNNSVERSEYIRRNRSTSNSDSSERNRTRSRSYSLNRRRIIKEQRNISRDSRGRRSESRDSRRRWSSRMNRNERLRASRDGRGQSGNGNSRGRRSSSRDSRRRRSASRDGRGRSGSRYSRGRRGSSRDSSRRRSASRDSRGRSGRGNSRGRRSSSKDSRRRRSASRDSSGRPSGRRSNRGRRIASSGSQKRRGSSRDMRR